MISHINVLMSKSSLLWERPKSGALSSPCKSERDMPKNACKSKKKHEKGDEKGNEKGDEKADKRLNCLKTA
jgi:hypothetical protein